MTLEQCEDEDRFGYTYRCFGCGQWCDGPWCGCEKGKYLMSDEELVGIARYELDLEVDDDCC